jgi:signal transduction histidine kinase
VADNGIGIEPGRREAVFKMFERLDAGQDHPGTGIGLAICQTVVERHGGRIWVEDTHGGGSRFCFTLPSSPAPGCE